MKLSKVIQRERKNSKIIKKPSWRKEHQNKKSKHDEIKRAREEKEKQEEEMLN